MADKKVTVQVNFSQPEFISGLELGVTHTAYALDNCGHPQANARGSALLSDACRLHNAHVHGWGVLFPEVSPGKWDWSTLDRRIEYIRSIGGTPVITLCAAPDWMKGPYDPAEEQLYLDHGQAWWWFEKSPLPEHFADYARVCVEVAKRYPDVRHFQVWNEMKGFVYEDRNHQFDNHIQIYYEEYTEFYNIVYTALKEHDKTLQVGGFYPVLVGNGTEKGGYYTCKPIAPYDKEALLYWLEHKAGADFICLDRSMNGWWDKNTYTNDETIDTAVEFENIMGQIHELCDLPIWWSEYYFAGEKGTKFLEACAATLLYHIVRGRGETKALLWNPMDSEGLNTALFTANTEAEGCRPVPHYNIWRTFNKQFGRGRAIYPSRVSPEGDVLCLAGEELIALINKRDELIEAELCGRAVTLSPYEVVFISK